MCIGIPMRVVETGVGYAWCEGLGRRSKIDTRLVGDPPVGTWLLTFLGGAREVLSGEDAAKITDAVTALALVMEGEQDVDHLFADLVEREPRRPQTAPPLAARTAKGDR